VAALGHRASISQVPLNLPGVHINSSNEMPRRVRLREKLTVNIRENRRKLMQNNEELTLNEGKWMLNLREGAMMLIDKYLSAG
jgi:hypothetical protein